MSDFPWGWAPFHYGRWFFDNYRGWVWVPGPTWSPAWVAWHYGDAWCGWAPLPPGVEWEATPNWDVVIAPFAWCFVGRGDFLRTRLREHIIVPARNVTLLRETRNVTHFERLGPHIANRSLSDVEIEHFTGKSARRA